jgi:hypothetical protein
VSVYERLEALNLGRCGVDASQPRNFSVGVCYLKSVCGAELVVYSILYERWSCRKAVWI